MKREYPSIEINLSKLKHNAEEMVRLCEEKGIEAAAVTKLFCADKEISKVILNAGVKILADSRIDNLRKFEDYECKTMLLRIPMKSELEKVVSCVDICQISEIETIKELSKIAKEFNKVQDIILMVDLGDLREGVLESDVLNIAGEISKLENINLLGLGTNLTCYGGVIPDENNLGRLITLKDEINKSLNMNLSVVSGGNSSSLYMVLNNTIPSGVNMLRIGEALVLGRETAYGEAVPNCYNDGLTLKAEIVEIKDKPSVPIGNIGMDAFGQKPTFENRGIRKRAILAIGRQDINLSGMCPVDKRIRILGASSDHLIVDITDTNNNYNLGDIIEFNMDYGCVLMAMTSSYVKKYYVE